MSLVEIDSDGNGDLESRLEYEYNDNGIRTSQTETTDTDEDGDLGDETPQRTDYLIDEHNPTGYAQVLEEWLNGTLAKTYTIGHDVFAEAAAGGVIRRLLKDGHGSTRMLVDALGMPITDGGTIQVFRFDAYGNAIAFNPALALTTLLYNSEQFDHLTGLTYLRARYYDPNTGRFNRLDPFAGNMRDPQSLHKLLFVDGDPINGIDPTGFFTQAFGYLAEAAITTDHKIDFPFPLFNVSYGAWAGLPGAFTAKPDILNFTDFEYNEIKPLSPSGILAATAQMALREIQFGPLGFEPDPDWAKIPRFTVAGTVPIMYFNLYGVICGRSRGKGQ